MADVLEICYTPNGARVVDYTMGSKSILYFHVSDFLVTISDCKLSWGILANFNCSNNVQH